MPHPNPPHPRPHPQDHWSGSESLFALGLLAAIVFLLTGSVPIGLAVFAGGALAIGRGRAVRRNRW